MTTITRALLSVSDTTGLLPFATALSRNGIELLATRGTANTLTAGGLEVRALEDITGFAEILDGRVKTLHPAVHAGLLARRDSPAHMDALKAHGFAPIDLLVVTLYPFEDHTAQDSSPDSSQDSSPDSSQDSSYETCLEHIDIGGVTLLRGGAKNHQSVTVLTDPEDYPGVKDEIEATGNTSLSTRRRLAQKAFARIAVYDAAISRWLAGTQTEGKAGPVHILGGTLKQTLRYGENPHQTGAFYATSHHGLAAARQVQGKELSYNNLLDADAALAAVASLPSPAAVIVKHTSPCGAARAATLQEAVRAARQSDPQSAFGGIIALNAPLDEAAAREILSVFTEVVIAPQGEAAALELFKTKPRLRLLLTQEAAAPAAGETVVRTVRGGFLTQSADTKPLDWNKVICVAGQTPQGAVREDLLFAWDVCRHVKSNAIVLAHHGATVGIGGGLTSRVDATRLALSKAGPRAKGAVAASDAFFPFADALESLAHAGVAAVIQPGGAQRDADITAMAKKLNICMLITGQRHFRH